MSDARLLAFMFVVAWLGVVSAYDPGDVNGDGSVDATDVSCTTATVYDSDYGCAVATMAPLQHVVTVSPDGGDYTSINAALADITASDTERWLINVGPGTYNEQITMEPYVDIEGAGPGQTHIVAGGGDTTAAGATVTAADNAELRSVSVISNGGQSATVAAAIFADGTSPSLSDVAAVAEDAANTEVAMSIVGGSPVLSDVTLSAIGTISDSSYGLKNGAGAAPETENVTISVTTSSSSSSAYGVASDSSTLRLEGLGIDVSGGRYAYGVYSSSSTVTVSRSRVSVTGASDDTAGVWSHECPAVDLRFCRIEADADGGLSAWGARYTMSDGRIRHCVVSASGGANDSMGVELESAVSGHVVEVTSSDVLATGDYARGSTPDADAVRLAGCTLVGTGVGNITCAGNWDDTFTFYASTCP